MNRRTFLAISAAAAAAPYASFAVENATASPENTHMRINEPLLRGRNHNRSSVVARHGMVSASQPLATIAGVDMLKAGGSAVDAAIAANAMLSLVEPMNCGPGGDLFAIVWDAKGGELLGLNASGRAPYDWTLDKAEGLGLKEIPGFSPHAWNVPGCVSGWEALHGKLGRLSRDQVLAPAIVAAREGFAVSPVVAYDWAFESAGHPTLAAVFQPSGSAPAYGDIHANPALADTLELLAKEGWRAFYDGAIGEKIVKFSQENEGHFSARDFAEHTADWVEPVSTSYRGFDVWELPPNGQGIAVLQMLNMLETFDIGSLEPNSAEHLHLLIEAKKLAYEDRAVYYADPDFAEVPTPWLISKEYGRERAKRIDPKRAARTATFGEKHSDTIYLTAADAEGNMVSLIQSIYGRWGSRIVPAGLGFALQNRGESFSLNPKHRNALAPRKRPFHTIIPAFLTQDGQPRMSFGVMGGAFQPQGHSQVLMNMLDFGMDPQQAGDQPRVEHNGSSDPTGSVMKEGGTVKLEQRIPDTVRQELEDLGHTVDVNTGAFGGYQAIWREEEPMRYFGGSDPRKDGASMGW